MKNSKKQQVFYIHGGGSYSRQEDFLNTLRSREIRNLPGIDQPKKWAGSLRDDLGEKFEVFTPSMPNSDNAKYEEWQIWFERHFEYLRNDIILIGWSLGGMFLMKYLTENKFPYQIKALFLIAAPAVPFAGEPEDCAEFAFSLENSASLVEKCEKIYLFHSKDDFVVPYEHALTIKQFLPKAELITFEDKNHFLIEEFPELVGKIKACL